MVKLSEVGVCTITLSDLFELWKTNNSALSFYQLCDFRDGLHIMILDTSCDIPTPTSAVVW